MKSLPFPIDLLNDDSKVGDKYPYEKTLPVRTGGRRKLCDP